MDRSIHQAATELSGDRHAFQTENVNRSLIRATCKCGWRMPIARRKALGTVEDWEFHVLIYESKYRESQ
jgi:hypothetical protein